MAFEHPIEWTDENVSRLWDYYSRTPPYSEIYFSKVFGDRILKKSGLPFNQDISVLDFGCGPGFLWEHARTLATRWNYTALDFSPDSVDKVLTKAHGHVQFKGAHHTSQLPTNLPAEHFDAVLLIEVVEHLKDEYLDGTLEEIARILKRGGVVVISTPNEENLAASTSYCPDCGAVFHVWQHIRSWSVASLENKLQLHGFKLIQYQTLDFTANSLLRKFVRLAKMVLRGDPGKPHMIATFQKL
jgi:2-polyprenyl-3-methyl-5-hydroxy-6-metoxy-1,4-benzoquinol methylase